MSFQILGEVFSECFQILGEVVSNFGRGRFQSLGEVSNFGRGRLGAPQI